LLPLPLIWLPESTLLLAQRSAGAANRAAAEQSRRKKQKQLKQKQLKQKQKKKKKKKKRGRPPCLLGTQPSSGSPRARQQQLLSGSTSFRRTLPARPSTIPSSSRAPLPPKAPRKRQPRWRRWRMLLLSLLPPKKEKRGGRWKKRSEGRKRRSSISGRK
jgi:hypothetical protein